SPARWAYHANALGSSKRAPRANCAASSPTTKTRPFKSGCGASYPARPPALLVSSRDEHPACVVSRGHPHELTTLPERTSHEDHLNHLGCPARELGGGGRIRFDHRPIDARFQLRGKGEPRPITARRIGRAPAR